MVNVVMTALVYLLTMVMSYILKRAGLFHKEDKTSNLVWGGEDSIKPSLYARDSITHWYKKHYLPSGQEKNK